MQGFTKSWRGRRGPVPDRRHSADEPAAAHRDHSTRRDPLAYPNLADLAPEKRRLLVEADRMGVIVFFIQKDEAVADLLASGLLDAQLRDGDHALLFLTRAGAAAAAQLSAGRS